MLRAAGKILLLPYALHHVTINSEGICLAVLNRSKLISSSKNCGKKTAFFDGQLDRHSPTITVIDISCSSYAKVDHRNEIDTSVSLGAYGSFKYLSKSNLPC